MAHEIYTYPKSRELFTRAARVIPSGVYGHLGPAEGCFIPIEAYPLFGDRAPAIGRQSDQHHRRQKERYCLFHARLPSPLSF